ncbi:lysosomal amino acid transporter 1 homolog [Acipenser ruthenus]|uniref:lysosomal amino acid transporter 1 homolog n=1 Tax=Acipenser ruthenus TaxID=7906 RepID=UPI00145A982D|nr:lysosomal amino acid transporter 1 homolog [Acipenser ruthenus]XP_058876178.1 lysosomal amino acid transporter 1 homolog [Acipenser ruthenus]
MDTSGLTRGALGSGPLDGNFSSLCPNGSVWVWKGLRECAEDSRDMASVVLGLLSIVCFMVSSLPQYYRSYKSGNMDQALSIWFLLGWLGGDSCNLIGSFLADQLPLQSYTAVYYILADLLMLGLYLYYKMKNRNTEWRSGVLNTVGVFSLLGVSASLSLFKGAGLHSDTPPGFRGRVLLSLTADENGAESFTSLEIVGFAIGSVSSVLYLCSRGPQIYTNFKRKSTAGVSCFLFALVILGNMTYGLSVLLKNPDRGQAEGNYVLHHLPWLIGSLGTLSLDIIIALQFMLYQNPPPEEKSEERAALLDKESNGSVYGSQDPASGGGGGLCDCCVCG